MPNTQQIKEQLQQLIAQGAIIHYPNPTLSEHQKLIKEIEELAHKLLNLAQELRRELEQ